MNFTKLAINNNRVTYIFLILVIIMGMMGYNSLSRDSMPPYTVRIATVVTNFPGAGPERVESLISDKIEKVIQEIPEVDYISSQSRTGLSVVTVKLKDNVSENKLQPVWDRIRRKIDGIKKDLPSGISGPNVKDEDKGVVYGIIVGLASDGFDYAETKDYAEDLRDQLITLEDAAKVELGGITEERIFIDYNDAELTKYGISGKQLKNAISATNIIIPAGEVNLGNERIIMEPTGNLESVEEISNILIPIGNAGETIKLGDITSVRRDYITPKKTIIKINGSVGIALYISLKKGANIIHLGEEVDQLLLEYNNNLPVGLTAKRLASQDEDVNLIIDSFVSNVIQSVLIVLLVMLLFLGIRTGFVVATLIPATIICTLLIMNVLNVGLNQVSLAALIMALGMLVDNAIVMVESMMVKMEKGASAFESAISSSKELMTPLLISSLTTCAAFLAFYLAESTMGEIMGELFIVITIALLSSWVMALTIVPLLAVVIIKVKKNKQNDKETIFDKLNTHYNKLLKYTLRHPAITLITIVFLFVLSLFGFMKIPVNFMPDSERNLITLNLNLPLGTNIETTQMEVKNIENYIKTDLLTNDTRSKGVLDWSTFIGKGPNSYDLGYSPGEANSGYAHILVNTSSGEDNQYVINELEKFCFYNVPDAEVTIKRLGSGGGAATPVQVRFMGDDITELYAMVAATKSKLRTIPGTKKIDDDWGPKIKKIVVQINQSKLGQSGLTNQDIASSLNTYLSGQNIGDYREDDNTIPITMQAKGNQNIAFSDLESLSIFSQNSGKNVPLVQVASIVPEWQYAKILRRNLKRTITVNCQLKEGYTATNITNVLKPWLEEQSDELKNDIRYELGGESESSSVAMGAIADKLSITFLIIILLLVLQFNSIRKTIIVLSTIPLGIIGVVAGLLSTGSFFSFMAFLGLISLAGIVINNAIVLLDRIQIELENTQRSHLDSVIQAANERFRPILLTTFTTSLGLVPLWIGGGIMWAPMAIGIIFGLLFATVITLVFVPLMYKLLFKIKYED